MGVPTSLEQLIELGPGRKLPGLFLLLQIPGFFRFNAGTTF